MLAEVVLGKMAEVKVPAGVTAAAIRALDWIIVVNTRPLLRALVSIYSAIRTRNWSLVKSRTVALSFVQQITR